MCGVWVWWVVRRVWVVGGVSVGGEDGGVGSGWCGCCVSVESVGGECGGGGCQC